jgi:VCBS repeat-containing protein
VRGGSELLYDIDIAYNNLPGVNNMLISSSAEKDDFGNYSNSGTPNNLPILGDTLKSISLDFSPFAIAIKEGTLYVGDQNSSGLIYLIDPVTSEIINSINIGYYVCGIEWDGTSFWISDCSLDIIIQFDENWNEIKSFNSPASGPVGLSWDGEFLWNTDFEAQTIYQIDAESEIVLKSIPAPDTRPAGAAWDGSGLWVNGRDNATTHKLDAETGAIIQSFPTPPLVTTNNGSGLVFDGQYLYVAHGDLSKIYLVDIEFQPSSWLSILESGSVPKGSSVALNVDFNATGLLIGGLYEATINISSNDPENQFVEVPVRLDVINGGPDIAVDTDSIDFGEVHVGGSLVEFVRVSNVGTDSLGVTSVQAGSADFSIDTSSFGLLPGEWIDLTVTYSPTSAEVDDTELLIISNDSDEGTLSIALVGTGVEPPANIAPTLRDSVFTIEENTAMGATIGVLDGQDLNGDTITYSIVIGNEQSAFNLSDEGLLTVNDSSVLDYETSSSFELEVEVSDGFLSDSGIITVNLIDVNESPLIEDQILSLLENASSGFVVDTLNAFDVDNDVLDFYIISGNEQGAFILSEGGVLTVADSSLIDFEVNSSFSINVEVSDEEFTASATIEIEIIDIEENHIPQINDQFFSIDENSSNGSIVGTVSSEDPDGDEMSFVIASGNELGAFQIDSASGEITISDSLILDYEQTSSFSLMVNVDDGIGQSSANITIDLNDLNERPFDILLSSDTITEDSETGTLIGLLTTQDQDANDSFTYAVTVGDALFDVNENELISKIIFDFENSNSHAIEITTSDQGGLNFSKFFVITVIDVFEDILGFEKNELVVYPNPAKDFIVVKWEDYASATLTSLSGKNIITTSSSVIDIQNLKPGIYLITLESVDKKQSTLKIIKE